MQLKNLKVLSVLLALAMIMTSVPVYARECSYWADLGYDSECTDQDGDGYCDDCEEAMPTEKQTPSYSTSLSSENDLDAGVEASFTVSTDSDAEASYWAPDGVSCSIEGSGGEYTYKITASSSGQFYFRVKFAATESYEEINEMYTLNVSESQVIQSADLSISGPEYGTVGEQYEATISTDSTATPYIKGDQIYDYSDVMTSFTNGGAEISATIEGDKLKVTCSRAGKYSIPIYVDATDGYEEDHTNFAVEFKAAEVAAGPLQVDGKTASDRKQTSIGTSSTYQLSGDTSNLTFDWANRYSEGNIEYSYDEDTKVLTITALHFYSGNTGVKVIDNNASKTVYCWCKTKKGEGVVTLKNSNEEVVSIVTTQIGKSVTLTRSLNFSGNYIVPTVVDENIATVAVDTNDKIIINPVLIGTTTMEFSAEANTDYNVTPTTLVVEVVEGVTKQDPTITISKTATDTTGMSDQTFTVECNSDAPLQASSSNENITATLNDHTVTVHATREGSATITVYTEETDNFNAGSATYAAVFAEASTPAGDLPTGYFYNREAGRIYSYDGDSVRVFESDNTLQFELDDLTVETVEGSTSRDAAYFIFGKVTEVGDMCNYSKDKYVAIAFTHYNGDWRVSTITSGLQKDSKSEVRDATYVAVNDMKNDESIRQPIGSTVGYPLYPFYVYSERMHENGQPEGSPLAQYVKWVITKTSTFSSEVKQISMGDEYFFPVCEVSEQLTLNTRTAKLVSEDGTELLSIEIPVKEDVIDKKTGYTTICTSIIEPPVGKAFGGIYQDGQLCYTYTMGGKYYTSIVLNSDAEVTVKFVDEDYIIEDEVKTFNSDKVKVEG